MEAIGEGVKNLSVGQRITAAGGLYTWADKFVARAAALVPLPDDNFRATLDQSPINATRQCDGCITVHTDAATRHGATVKEIAETLGIAIAANAGAALVYSVRAMDAFSVKHP